MKSSITNKNEKTSEISRIHLTHYELDMAVKKEVLKTQFYLMLM